MDLLRENQYVLHLLVCCLGCLCGLAFGQVSEALTGSANFSSIELTCIANLAAFLVFILRGKYWYDYWNKKLLVLLRSVKLRDIEGLRVLTTSRGELQECSVVMLSFQMPMPTTSMSKFMSYMSNVYDVHSIFLQCLPLQSVAVTVEMCTDTCTENHKGTCGCIVFNTVKDITSMLVHRMPGTVKRLSDSLSLLPSLRCLKNGCHGCNQGLLHVENGRLREGNSEVESPAAVCEILDLKSIHKVSTCICIPVRSAYHDEWTNKLRKLFKPAEEEFRGAVIREGRTNACSALENYKNGYGECDADEKYKFTSLIIVPRLTLVLITVVLTFWLKVDGFSSALIVVMVVERYPPGINSDFYPHLFLTRARVKSNASNTNVCQVLFFRDYLQTWVLSDSLQSSVNLICAVSWIVLVALEGGANKWYRTHSMAPSKPRIVVILIGICTAMVMDAFDLNLSLQVRRMPGFRRNDYRKITPIICAIIVLEILCIVACSAIAGVMGIKVFGRWIYSALQCLVWVKWYIGLDLKSQYSLEYGELNWWYDSCGLYIVCSAVLLNALLAGVRANWEFS